MAHQQQPQQQETDAVGADRGLNLPPGFQFHPSDNEIVSIYLTNKVLNRDITSTIITEVDLNKTKPWDLPGKAKMGEKEWCFFYQKDRKYPTGLRANWTTKAGYWKATGKDKEVNNTTKGVELLIGMKKTLVFYQGKAPMGNKTNWVMHEYRLEGSGRLPGPFASSLAADVTAVKASTSASKMKFTQNEWVLCRVFDKTTRMKKMTASAYQMDMANAQIDQNQNNIPAIAIPMPLQLPPPVPMPTRLPILPDFAMDPVAPYYPNAGTGIPPMIPPMAGIGGTDRFQINDALCGNLIAAPPQMNFYHQMGMGAADGIWA